MALDFSRLPPEHPGPDRPPLRFVWTVVFFLLGLAGASAVLMLWPAGEPARTPWFWFCVVVAPFGLGAFVVSRRYSVYYGRCLDAQANNEACKRYREEAFAHESIPVPVLGCAMRVCGDAEPGGVEQIKDGTLTLGSQASGHEENASIAARWLTPQEACLARDDAERHAIVLQWLFDQLLDELDAQLAALPEDLALRVLLDISGYLGTKGVVEMWRASWQGHQMRGAAVYRASEAYGVMAIDQWLDDPDEPFAHGALLFISASLDTMLDDVPVNGAAEVGVALLLVSANSAQQHDLHPVAAIHRPRQSGSEGVDHALTCALKWGHAEPGAVWGVWMTGFDGDSVGLLNSAMEHAGLIEKDREAPTRYDLDRSVGRAGPSAGWLALTCAAHEAVTAAGPQLVAQRHRGHMVLAVVTTYSNESNETRAHA